MKRTTVAALLSLFTVNAAADLAESEPLPPVRVSLAGQREIPSETIVGKRIYIYSDKDERFAVVIRKNMRSKGLSVAENEDDADIKLKAVGLFRVSGKGLSPVSGQLGEIVGSSIAEPTSPDYARSSVKPDHVVGTALISGISAVSVANLGIWLTQQTGVAGFFNKMITGDPRGICLHENCYKFEQRVVVAMLGDGISVQALAVAHHEKLMMDIIADQAVAEVMRAFPASSKHHSNLESAH